LALSSVSAAGNGAGSGDGARLVEVRPA
jgi:hypothetical protein